ncbi:PAS domain-containing sensor histidine kinase [Alsobacter soli]|uniref:Sensor protein FixL n=1 Tax=Alsobacter soli TaxID=2109933 RepID=A0A2T1HYI7_9HYPH|nr:PAS domain S-box protein [Alsobacter soli]PSC06674.1 PAS domain-containing sensor histidine kinase [Alsobacter soli]
MADFRDGAAITTVSDARLASVLDTAVDGILVIEERGKILVYNKACEGLFGYTPEEAIGQNVRLIMPADYADSHDQYLDNYLSTGSKRIIGIGREVRARHKDTTEFPVELSVGEARTPEGRQFIGIIRDLRSRKEAERRFNELQSDLVHMARVSAMDEMGAALAHELNQPLTAIMLYLQAASRSITRAVQGAPLPIDSFRQVLEKAVHEAERAGAIISRMRHFVEKREPQRRDVDIRAIVDEALELVMLGQRNPPRVTRNYASDLPLVSVDAVQIQQIIVNLLRNANEALKGRELPMVTIGAERRADHIVISVEDNGPGLPPSAIPTLFKAFSTSKRTGMGLGLSISRTIAQNHAGDLKVDPGGNGRGARFELELPINGGGSPASASDQQG